MPCLNYFLLHKHSPRLYKMHFHIWKQKGLLPIVFQTWGWKYYQRSLEENLHKTEGQFSLETRCPALSEEMLHTHYRGQWLWTATHMTKVQYSICLSGMLRTLWKMFSSKKSKIDIRILLHMERVALLHSIFSSSSSNLIKLQAWMSVLFWVCMQ